MEPIFHIVIPALLLMVLFPKLNKFHVVIIAIIMELLMDLDHFMPGYHRIFTHNIFWILILTLLAYYIISKKVGLMVLFYGISHLILDLWHFGIAFLWPLVSLLFAFDINASSINPYFFSFEFKIFSFDQLKTAEYTSYYMTQWGASTLILIGLSMLVWYIISKKLVSKQGKIHPKPL